MKRTTFDESRDQRIANETTRDRSLSCIGTGCPNRWSVDAGNGKLCSAHAWVDAHQWPIVTREQQDAETQRAIDEQRPKPVLSARRGPKPHEVDAIRRLSSLQSGGRDQRAWATALKRRDDAGERISEAQRSMYREALRQHLPVLAQEDRWN